MFLRYVLKKWNLLFDNGSKNDEKFQDKSDLQDKVKEGAKKAVEEYRGALEKLADYDKMKSHG